MEAWPRSARMPPPGRPMLPEQQLEDRRGPDVLHADRVLGPADRVAEGGGALAPEFAQSASATLQEQLARHAADLLHHLRRVAREVPLQDLEDAARVLERLVALLGRGRRCSASAPGAASARGAPAARRRVRRPRTARSDVVPAASASKPLKRPSRSSVSRKSSPMMAGRVGVGHHVLPEIALVLEDVADEPAEEGDVGARRGSARGCRPSRCVRVKRGSTWMMVAPRSLGLHHPAEADRVALGHVRALDDDAVRVLQVLLEGRRAAASEG